MKNINEIKQIAEYRLRDYLTFKGMAIDDTLIFETNLNQIGFDDIDWGILVGEIQSDCMMMLDWSVDFNDINTLMDVVVKLKYDGFEDLWDINNTMERLWDQETLEHIVTNASENIWEC